MLRFCGEKQTKSNSLNVTVLEEQILMDNSLWRNGRQYFRRAKKEQRGSLAMPMLPIVDQKGNIVCYGWQDDEANRELRMLKELERCEVALQFQDIFPEVQEVFICGCNELAYYFAKYLEHCQVKVSVFGEYWECFGYKCVEISDYDDEKQMMIQAERIQEKMGDLYQRLIRSASSEFECIDTIYEMNVKDEKIKDVEGKVDWLLEKIKGKDVFLIGISVEAQDSYDWLYAHGIDIAGFIFGEEESYGVNFFLGKKRVSIGEILNCGGNVVVINCIDRNGALGTESGEYYHYYCGFERNEQYFVIRDYVNIPCSNLIHILKGKTVFLAGEERFCKILADYLESIEKGEIDIQCGELSESRKMKENDILCMVYPTDRLKNDIGEKAKKFWKTASGMGEGRATKYFSNSRVYIAIDHYMNKNKVKYSMRQLKPQGILLGEIPGFAGCGFIKGIMDGHPNIISAPYNLFIDDLLLYCIRLAGVESKDLLNVFKRVLEDEYESLEISNCFPDFDIFKNYAERRLSQKSRFTSQELFMIFIVSYTEMMTGEDIIDISSKVIYWEPHGIDRKKFCFLEEWLEDEEINGQTMVVRRDNLTYRASWYNYNLLNGGVPNLDFTAISLLSNEYNVDSSYDTLRCENWQTFKMRFEDIKLHPEEELLKICTRMDIPWSDTMLQTTSYGEAQIHCGSQDFTLKPVFDRREKYFSEFDQFRISVISAPYQKKYGYPYVDCMEFSRNRLWEMFLEEFRFQKMMQFTTFKNRASYYLKVYKSLSRQLWETRKHAVLGDIVPEFEPVEIGRSVDESKTKLVKRKTNPEKLVEFIRQQEKLVLYGTGRDCDALIQFLTETERDRLLYADKKASQGMYIYQGKKVLSPCELCGEYREYMILVISSMYATSIRWELEDMGIAPERIICNHGRIWTG